VEALLEQRLGASCSRRLRTARLKIRGNDNDKGGRAARGRSPKEKREVGLQRGQSGIVLWRWPGFGSTSSPFFLTSTLVSLVHCRWRSVRRSWSFFFLSPGLAHKTREPTRGAPNSLEPNTLAGACEPSKARSNSLYFITDVDTLASLLAAPV
jgi:hypothetical protein